jgi:hypothetical protein
MALWPTVAAADYEDAATRFEALFSWTFSYSGQDENLDVRNIFLADASTEPCILTHSTTISVDDVVSQTTSVRIDLADVETESIGSHQLSNPGFSEPPYAWSVYLRPRDHRGSPVTRTVFIESILNAPENASCTTVPCTIPEADNNPLLFPKGVRENGIAEGVEAALALIEQCQ